MKLITTSHALQSTFSRLLQDYPNLEFAVAWASADTNMFRELIARPNPIKRAVIGTHFYQTHPDVLDAFVDSQSVRFMLQPSGVFHPKIYLFSNLNEWEALIGSANFTTGAFKNNAEVMVLIAHSDGNASSLDLELRTIIDTYWKGGKAANKDSASAYRIMWQAMRSSLKRLSGQYGNKAANRAPVESSVMSMSWDQLLPLIWKQGPVELSDRCGLLVTTKKAFEDHIHFSLMDIGLRLAIAGLPTEHDTRSAWFGSMKGAGRFWKAINSNNSHISAALDKIPAQGPVDRSQYDLYVTEFKKAFSTGGHGVAIASRLLTLKRPDYFVCLSSKNRTRLCENFGIKSNGIDFHGYWDEVILPIIDSPWWNSSRPSNEDAQIWDGRVAMLDAIFYHP